MRTLEGKRILVTGGTGSLGKTLVGRILKGDRGVPKKLVIMSRDEGKQHEMRLSYLHRQASTDDVIYRNFQQTLEFRIGDVRDDADVASAMRDADIVINAAALKQVPTCEYFPAQAVMTNCLGAQNIVKTIAEGKAQPEVVIGISTDKACKPVNVMGMSKSIQERIFIAGNIYAPKTRFVCVRYGNVLASRGSVIPMFHDQIRRGGPVTITIPGMTRFLLSLDQAVDTVFAALDAAKPGEIFVPNAPSATVINLAKALIGHRRIAIKTIGIRPGEKMHEIMVSEEEFMRATRRGDYYAIKPMLPELRSNGEYEPDALDKEFSSADVVMSLAATKELLARHRLLLEDRDFAETAELLR